MTANQEKQLIKDLQDCESLEQMLAVLKESFLLQECRPSKMVRDKTAKELAKALKRLPKLKVRQNSNLDLADRIESADKGERSIMEMILNGRLKNG